MKLLVGLSLLTLALAGCTTEPTFATPPMEGDAYVIEMTASLMFTPKNFEVPAGATVIFRNTGEVGHDVESPTNAFQTSPMLYGGEEHTITAPSEPGDYPFWCNPHKANGMTGVMRVV